jgi:hypothetical protein
MTDQEKALLDGLDIRWKADAVGDDYPPHALLKRHKAALTAARREERERLAKIAERKEMEGFSLRAHHIRALLDAPADDPAPIPMMLHCPSCGQQHIDEPNPEKGWENPPHRSHECQHCGCIWRPADVATAGVREIQTQGRADTYHFDQRVKRWFNAPLPTPPATGETT